ncbi:uncharacterized protein BCR38DRAFT_345664 [Pseudomassariella vexata]|uniref:LysM domain-containing protein n=1 Tax=Pseudomassariella vexata TaxID=1141098 RepID=A0A1Y2DVV6_9PEZI|nr:uncharacterized protein BCR38DRAFT_345664 [Pseudomassariella vexata]ORY63422.1 hypothetical protein BCR38DRAFT_345664 [Pseudomassariella vexata]
MSESCCTCATLLIQVPRYSECSEKPVPADRQLECCPRVICGNCLHKNERFNTYCPYCQISQAPTSLPQGLKEPPSYTSIATTSSSSSYSLAPPPYSATADQPRKPVDPLDEKSVPLDDEPPAEDTLHFLNHTHDTISSLSLRYGVPASALRRANNITSDHLLLGRRTVIIPAEYYKVGVSLSPRPVDGEEEELRKSKIRRFMVRCKVSEYDVAVLYLEQSGYDLDEAIEAYVADEEWEKNHPVKGLGRGKEVERAAAGKRRGLSWKRRD